MLSVKFLEYVNRFWLTNFVELLKKITKSVGPYCANISRCTVRKILKINLHRREDVQTHVVFLLLRNRMIGHHQLDSSSLYLTPSYFVQFTSILRLQIIHVFKVTVQEALTNS